MENNEKLEAIIREISPETLKSFLRSKTAEFSMGGSHDLSEYIDDKFPDLQKVGELKFEDGEKALAIIVKVNDVLTERACRKAQYEKAKKILKDLHNYTAGIFVFCDNNKNFRFSLVYEQTLGARRTFNNFRRYTFYINPTANNKTFRQQLKTASFNSFGGSNGLREAFSINAVTDAFYNEFRPSFDAITGAVYKKSVKVQTESTRADLALLFVIRTIFLGFIQKREWIGDDENFIQNLWGEYKKAGFEGKDLFYQNWLEPLFFESLSSPAGRVLPRDKYDFSKETQKKLQFAPYLNGGLFKRKPRLDDEGYHITDKVIGDFFEFLFSYNFTIEENTLYDEDLELNPEFLGIIFERLVNKENGAVYTPRTEVDLMCRLSLVKWLQENLSGTVNVKDLYELFFHEDGQENGEEKDQKTGSFSQRELEELISKLENISVCDPAAGSGAFPVGMLHVLDEILQHLHGKLKDRTQPTAFDRKKGIIFNSLYGVEVREWAVWITQLRLWITLFIEAPESLKDSPEAILPSLDFKIRAGDSLVQRIGNKAFPVAEHPGISRQLKAKITALKNAKLDFFYNKRKDYDTVKRLEVSVFREILDDEISNRLEYIKRAKGLEKLVQPSLLGIDQPDLPINNYKQSIDDLEAEIDELKKQKSDIKDEHPFIWNIEFAEIFTEKGGFDVVIGNPPYIRQEDITDPKRKISTYKELLPEMVNLDFPRQFGNKSYIDKKSDLYIFFYIRALRLLNKKGIQTFICSNSWLDVGYGAWLQKFLLNTTPIHFIIDNHAKRSFSAADINTIISIFGAPRSKTDKNHIARFVAFKKPFDEVVSTENLLKIDSAEKVVSEDAFRVFPLSTEKLLESGLEFNAEEREQPGTGKYVGNKWGGKYLRAPDIYWTILNKGRKALGRLDKHFVGERYLNTGGADGFFIPSQVEILNKSLYRVVNDNCEDDCEPFSGEIESRYFTPLIKDYTKGNRIIEIADHDSWCLVINDKPSKLLQKYIDWGEEQKYHRRSVTKLQTPWYKPTNQMLSAADILVPRSFHDTFLIHTNPHKYLSLRFYRLHPIEKSQSKRLAAFLNSTLVFFFFETLGNKALGQGVLDFFMADFLSMDIPIVLSDEAETIFTKFSKREISNIYGELGPNGTSIKADRKQLDEIIFSEIGLTKGEQDGVYEAFLRLVDARISRAQNI